MRILKDFKIPNFKLPEFKFKNIEELDDLPEFNEPVKKPKESKIKLVEREKFDTIKEMFDICTTKYEKRIAFMEKYNHKETYTNITYKQYRDDVINFGTCLTEHFNIHNEKIAVMGENTYQWYVAYMSTICSDSIIVPIDKELPANEIANLLNRAGVSVIVYSPKKKEVIEKLKNDLPSIKYFVEMYSDVPVNEKNVGFNYAKNIGKSLVDKGICTLMKLPTNPDEFKVLLFTSGTTSLPKGVMLNQRSLIENIHSAVSLVETIDKEVFFSVLPLHHTYEATVGYLIPISIGATIGICEGLKYIAQNLQEIKPTIMLAVPVLIENLYKKIQKSIEKGGKQKLVKSMVSLTNGLKSIGVDIKRKIFEEIHSTLGGKLRIIVSAAAPIDPIVGKAIEDYGILFLQGYGLTETAPLAALTPSSMPKIGSAGREVPCDILRIDSPNEASIGEICVKGPNVMMGYYENEEETNKVLKDGWFYTGDVGYIDDDKFLFITGRTKNVIVTQNGKNIYPEEIELELIRNIPYIQECMVYGKEEEGKKELIVSVKITLNEEYILETFKKRPTDKELYDIIWKAIKELNKQFVSYKAIRNLEIKNDDFIKTTTMKIKRYEEMQKDKNKKDISKKIPKEKKSDKINNK
ncbi:MAG: AMP-binding protein [Clostridia bacterium]